VTRGQARSHEACHSLAKGNPILQVALITRRMGPRLREDDNQIR